MPTIAEAVRESRRRIDDFEEPARRQMVRLYRDTVDHIVRELEIVTAQLSSFPIPASWFDDAGRFTPYGELAFRQQRLSQLIPIAEAEFARFSDDAVRIIDGTRFQAIRGGSASARDLARADGIGFVSRINTVAVETVAGLTSQGPVREILDGYGPRAMRTIESTLTSGIAAGESPRTILSRLKRDLIGANPARLEALVRTESMRAFRESMNQTYARMDHLISGYRWVAAHSRTCLACIAMDGRVQDEPWDQFHVQCRCLNTPVRIGSTSRYEAGEQWFERQRPETQERMFPSRAAYDAWQSGDVQLADFVGRTTDPVWGTSVYQRSGKDALRRAA